MHPIERLRYVARAGSAPDRILVAESVPALSAFATDPGATLVALRQLIVRQPQSPGLLCLAAHMVHSLESIEAGWEFSDLLEADPTAAQAEELALAEAGGTEVIDSLVSGPGIALCPLGTNSWIESARERGRSVVLVTPAGTRLPRLLWLSYLERCGVSAGDESTEQIPLDQFDDLLGPEGLGAVSSWRPDCPDVAEVARL